MIKRFYINNFRCLQNFELPISGIPSALLIGKNGAGKSTVGLALTVLQKIARGTNRVRDLVSAEDFTRGRESVLIRFEIEIEVNGDTYAYDLALELPDGFKEMRVAEESLHHNGTPVFARHTGQVTLARDSNPDSKFIVDWHLVALPVIQVQSEWDPIQVLKKWLARMLILGPIPQLIGGDSDDDTLEPVKSCVNFADWFTGLMTHSPSAYSRVDQYMRQLLTDFKDIKNPNVGKNSRSLIVQFERDNTTLNLDFEELSDGEKCFFICAVVLASNDAYGPLFCFWDEPDNYLSLSETGHFVMELRRSFQSGGQFLATSHNPEAIRRFSAENTFYLQRKSHFEPTVIHRISEFSLNDDLVDSLIRGDID